MSTCVILDFDDTLVPTSQSQLVGVTESTNPNIPFESYEQYLIKCRALRPLETLLTQCLTRFSQNPQCTVVIITNSEAGWVETCVKRYFSPAFYCLITSFPIISAASAYKSQLPQHTGESKWSWYTRWKARAMVDVVTWGVTRVVSIGDSYTDRDAFRQAQKVWADQKGMEKVCPISIKTLGRPTSEVLIRQWQLLSHVWSELITSNQSLDLGLQVDEVSPSPRPCPMCPPPSEIIPHSKTNTEDVVSVRV